ncbi:MAG: fluoride efflux transporter CrcB [Rubricoccaceae bacterium]|nr:fluoride efflux transporter CrcB [Rubricoccaceae bacterium]
MQSFLMVALGGALGASSRYGIGRWLIHHGHTGLPWGTWIANLVGCFLIGLALPYLAHGSHKLYLLAIVGFLGAFTTFSTFSMDTLLLIGNGKSGAALFNIAGTVVIGFVLVWGGVQVAKLLGATWP